MKRLTQSNKATGAVLAIAGVAAVTTASHVTAFDLISFALFMIGTAATVGGVTLATVEARA